MLTAPRLPARSRSGRQFVQLVRLSLRRMQDVALASRDVDADLFVLWGAALLVTPLFFTTITWTSRYPWLRQRSIELLHDAVIGDRLYFVIWPMLVMWLVGALLWDALFPDRTDQQVLGVLPVRPQAVAGARLTAALMVGGGMTLGIVVPPAVVYGLSGAAHPSVGPLVGIIVGQVVSSLAAGLFAFATLLTLRGLLVTIAGARAAARVAVVLQLVTVTALFQTFMFLPGLLPAAMRALQDPAVAVWAPPAWFMGLYALFAGPRSDQLTPLAPLALAAVAASLAGAAAVYLLPARRNARRVTEAVEPRRQRHPLSGLVRWGSRLLWTTGQRAIFVFILASIGRSRRHLMTLATYLGLGVALAGTRLLSAKVRGVALPIDQPFDYLLAIPLTITFFLVLGMRAAFAVPTDLGANWLFRVAGPRRVTRHLPAARLACAAVAVAPVSVLVLAAGSALWGAATATSVALMHAASGLLLVTLALATHTSVPFTRAHAFSPDALKTALPLAIVAVHLFAFRLDDIQRLALTVEYGSLWYAAAMVAAAAMVIGVGRGTSGRSQTSFDAPHDGAVTLSLSESSR